jgi:beta-galactosidase
MAAVRGEGPERPLLKPRVGLFYGGDYNPEQWPEEVWREDVRLMQEAGVNMVTLGVFSWALLEPEPGRYEFDWFDRIVELLWSNEIAIDLATPSAAPPAWLVRRHPEVLPMTADGVRMDFGSRRHYCPSSPIFREASERIAGQLALRYGEHPALAMWHVGNEYGGHISACFCDVSADHFRRWLRDRYGALDELNAAWGTAFWGQRYSDWSEIAPPRQTPASVNPTQALDWARFCSDAMLECFEAERSVLAAATPDVPITTNFMCRFEPVNGWRWAEREDVVTLDSYPDPTDPDAHVLAAFDYDLARSLGRGSWLLLEHAASAVNWRELNVPKRPGLMRLWALQAVARGSDGAMFFQWRAARAGSEKFHSALVPHLGTVARGWQNTLRLGRDLRALADVAGTRMRADVAILFDWENWWAFDGADHPSQRLNLVALVLDWYGPLYDANIAVDFAHPAADLDAYRLVLAPNLYLLRDESLASLRDFAANGGVLAVGCFSLVVDERDHVRAGDDTKPVRELLGARVDEFWPLPPDERVEVRLGSGEIATARDWSEWLELEGADVVAEYASGPLAGRPAVVHNRVGGGSVYYVSGRFDRPALELLVERLAAEASVEPIFPAPAGVEVTRREGSDAAYLFVLNHTDAAVEVELPERTAVELLTQETLGDAVRLGPLGVAVVRLAPRHG